MEEEQQIQRLEYPITRNQNQSDKTIKWKIEPDDVINDIIHYLRGDIYDENDMEWKPQGFIYNFKVFCPMWVHNRIMGLESEGFLKFDNCSYIRSSQEGFYSIYDFKREIKDNDEQKIMLVNSYNNIINLLEECKTTIESTKYADENKKEIFLYSFERQEPQRMVNETGLRVIATNLRGYLNKNIILSNFQTDEMINKIAMENAIEMCKLLYTSYDKFNIKKENFSTIVRVIDVNVYASLLRAKDGFFVHHLSTTERHVEHENVTLQNKPLEKKSFLPNIFGNWGSSN